MKMLQEPEDARKDRKVKYVQLLSLLQLFHSDML